MDEYLAALLLLGLGVGGVLTVYGASALVRVADKPLVCAVPLRDAGDRTAGQRHRRRRGGEHGPAPRPGSRRDDRRDGPSGASRGGVRPSLTASSTTTNGGAQSRPTCGSDSASTRSAGSSAGLASPGMTADQRWLDSLWQFVRTHPPPPRVSVLGWAAGPSVASCRRCAATATKRSGRPARTAGAGLPPRHIELYQPQRRFDVVVASTSR